MTVTFDTNVLVYATQRDDPARAARAVEVLERGARSGSALLLLQTLGEFAHVALRKAGMPVDRVIALAASWRALMPVHAAAEEDLASALQVFGQHGIPFWDAMLWATARRVGVRWLLSEDLQDGRVLGGVRFIDPFAPANGALLDRIFSA